MRVFLDIGAHHGETAHVALEPEFRFDHVYCFDPDPASWGYLEQLMADAPRVHAYPFGLWHQSVTLPLYGTGRRGCSVYEQNVMGRRGRVGEGVFVKASDWFAAHVSSDDFLVGKLNCEGAECQVLDDLMDGDWLSKLHALYVDFDVRKIPSQQHRHVEVLARLLRQHPLPFIVGPEDVPGPTHQDNVRYWLRLVGAAA